MSYIYEDTGPLDPNEVQGPPIEEREFIGNFTSYFNGICISPEDIQDEYEQKEGQKGLFVLFSPEKFVISEQSKNPNHIDLVQCLDGLGYEVQKKSLSEYPKKQVEHELEKIAKMDHSKRNSLIIVFLTSAEKGDALSCSDGYITCQEIWTFFTANKCESLSGKPKIFLFQACEHEDIPGVSTVYSDSILRSEMAKNVYTIPVEADILVAYSAFKGDRHSTLGYWFLQELCKNFTDYGRRDDIVTLFTRISKYVANHSPVERYKQMPCFISTLTRKFYVCKSNERGFILDVRNENDRILGKLENMEKRLNEFVQKDKKK